MSNTVYVRMVEKVVTTYASKPIEVNIDQLRKCDPPYTGDSNEQLLEYLEENVLLNEDFYDNETNMGSLGVYKAYDLSFEEGIISNENIIHTSVWDSEDKSIQLSETFDNDEFIVVSSTEDF